ncbi:hypothetical protein ACKTG8_004175 [Cronobacter sakazakii]|jgi:hypothetical protein|nr:hypothetical protein [Cronobacter sakazakii]
MFTLLLTFPQLAEFSTALYESLTQFLPGHPTYHARGTIWMVI